MAVKIDFDADFDEQVAQARAQRVLLPEAFYRLPAEKRALAFTVSGLARLDQVQAVADALARNLADGGTFEDFRKWALQQDWSLPRHRLETIYRNAVQTAYMAGHWRRFEEVKDDLPYLMYDAINDSRVRPSHLAMDGVIRPVDDPIWKRWSVPAGHRCRCTLRQLSAREAQRRGGVTPSIPAEAQPDEGWGGDPRDAWRGLDAALTGKLRQCKAVKAAFAEGGRVAQPLWCTEGPVRDFALMQQAWIARQGQMPEPRELTLPRLDYRSPHDGYAAFMRHMGLAESGGWVKTASDDVVFVSDALFKDLNGRWKWFKRGRDAWALYLAEVILRPQEAWLLKRGPDDALYLLARFARGSAIIEGIAVFRRDGRGRWSEGVTAFVADDKSAEYLKDKRRWLLNQAAFVRYLEV